MSRASPSRRGARIRAARGSESGAASLLEAAAAHKALATSLARERIYLRPQSRGAAQEAILAGIVASPSVIIRNRGNKLQLHHELGVPARACAHFAIWLVYGKCIKMASSSHARREVAHRRRTSACRLRGVGGGTAFSHRGNKLIICGVLSRSPAKPPLIARP